MAGSIAIHADRTGGLVANGGIEGQVYTKTGPADQQAGWQNLPDVDIEVTTQTVTYDCNEDIAIGDIVQRESLTSNFVVKAINNRGNVPAIGVVYDKPTSTQARIVVRGPFSLNISGLSVGKVWVGVNGLLTNTIPVNGYIQLIGYCFEEEKLFLSPEMIRIKRSPF